MQLEDARAAVVRYAQRMERDGLTVATSGNLSIRVGDRIAITPSGLDYEQLTPDDIAVCDLAGEQVEAGPAPSSELPMHLAAYRLDGVGAVVHAHSVYATVLSTLVDEVPPIHYLVALFGGPVRVTRYETFGTEALAEAMREALHERSAALLGNHGSIAVGDGLEVAYTRARYLEWISQVHYLASVGGTPSLLPDAEIDRVRERLVNYGRPSERRRPRPPKDRPGT